MCVCGGGMSHARVCVYVWGISHVCLWDMSHVWGHESCVCGGGHESWGEASHVGKGHVSCVWGHGACVWGQKTRVSHVLTCESCVRASHVCGSCG